jgi:hypothetical protein
MPEIAHAPLKFTSRPKGEVDEKVILFYLDETPYYVSSRPRANVALQVLDDVMQYGPAAAEVAMLRRAVGDEAFDALKAFDGLSSTDVQDLGRAITRLTVGALEDDKAGTRAGNSSDSSASA